MESRPIWAERLDERFEALKPEKNKAKAAAFLNVTAPMITKYTNGSDPGLSGALKLAEYLDTTVSYLVGETDEPRRFRNANSVTIPIIEIPDHGKPPSLSSASSFHQHPLMEGDSVPDGTFITQITDTSLEPEFNIESFLLIEAREPKKGEVGLFYSEEADMCIFGELKIGFMRAKSIHAFNGKDSFTTKQDVEIIGTVAAQVYLNK